MKRITLFALVLLAISACSTTPESSNANTTTQPANANATANANTSATPKAEATVKDSDITAKEQEIWNKIKTKDPEGFGGMLADDFIYIANDGVYDKAGTIDGIKQLDLTDLSFSDWKVVMLDKDAAVVTYTVNMKGTSGGQPIPPTPVRASSAWVNRGGKWVGVYHQSNPVKEAPPSQPESNKPAATAKATPPPPPPAANSSNDPLSNEKAVWDALKRKDYDGFASYLADNAIEVEETGVYDKAGSIKGVSQFDASKATLSDFKTMSLDSDATLVTYLVKIPIKGVSPLGERHSTIWMNQNGKWLAMFHHGTPVTPPAKAPAKK